MDILTRPLKLEPPFREPLLDAGGNISQPWVSWFTRVSDRLVELEARIAALEPP